MEQYQKRTELAVTPTEEEVMEAIVKLKGGKAGGRNGRTPRDGKELLGTVDELHAGLVSDCVE